MVDEPTQIHTITFALVDGHLQGVERQIGLETVTGVPAHDPPREDVHDERRVHPPLQGAHIGDIRDPQAVRSAGLETALHEVGGALLAGRRDRGAGLPSAARALDTQDPHHPLSGAPGDMPQTVLGSSLGTVEHDVDLAGPQDPVIGLVDPGDLGLEGLIAHRSG